MLYEENPKFLAQVLSTLVDEELGGKIGVQFRQQERKRGSTPDGLIAQPAFTLYLETKNFDWFYDDQLERHLDALAEEDPGIKVLIALSNFEADGVARFSRIRNLCSSKHKGAIIFEQVSFEDFAEALRVEHLPKNLADAVSDFRAYLDEQNLLPSWTRWLDVVNCAGIPADILKANVYLCPATGGPYNHGRCKYFGMYRNKRVEKVALIEAVVDLRDASDSALKWKNIDVDDATLLERARSSLSSRRPGQYPTRVFLLGPLHDTDFVKDSPGGMQASKQYFEVHALGVKNADELAGALRSKTWSELRGGSAV